MRNVAFGAVVLVGLTGMTAQAGDGKWSVGVSIGAPAVYRPWPHYHHHHHHYPFYRPYPVFVAPPPVVVREVPVIQPVPVVQPVYQPPPPAAPAPSQAVYHPTSAAQPPAGDDRQGDIDRSLRLLADPNENVRADAVMHLGRARTHRAIDPLAATLAGDASPLVREAAARALGLIGSPKALPALQRAAQVDADRDVRRSAQFAAEIVQSNRGY
jgi:hypothetical protein